MRGDLQVREHMRQAILVLALCFGSFGVATAQEITAEVPPCVDVRKLPDKIGPNWGDLGGECPIRASDGNCRDRLRTVRVTNGCMQDARIKYVKGSSGGGALVPVGTSTTLTCLEVGDQCDSIDVTGALVDLPGTPNAKPLMPGDKPSQATSTPSHAPSMPQATAAKSTRSMIRGCKTQEALNDGLHYMCGPRGSSGYGPMKCFGPDIDGHPEYCDGTVD